MYSYGPPHMAVQKQDDQHEHTFSNYVRIQDVVQKTCLRRWTIGKSVERGSGISVLPARHDDEVWSIHLFKMIVNFIKTLKLWLSMQPFVYLPIVFWLYMALQYWGSMSSNFLIFHTSGGVSSSPTDFLFFIFLSTKSSSCCVNCSGLMSSWLLIIFVIGSSVTFGGFLCKFSILSFSKKGDLRTAKNYRGITLTSIAAKIYNALVRNRMKPKIEKILRKNKNGFWRNRSTTS